MPIQTINPATGETLRTFDALSDPEVDARLARAEAAFQEYRHTSFAQRAAWMTRAAEILEESKDTLARLMTTEMGKPLAAAVAEVEKCAWACRHYAHDAERLLADEEVETDARRSFIRYLPLGPVLAVMPWNFPLWQVFRFAAPALMAGNVGVLKHASNVPQCALAIEDVLRRAGFPDGAFQTLLVGSKPWRASWTTRASAPRRSPGARRPGRAWPSAPGATSRRRCWSWAAATPSSSCPAPTWTQRRARP
jgi:succinate-semialdehyde dehydrogenase/glutarate-semialdehyde dehydrogenase